MVLNSECAIGPYRSGARLPPSQDTNIPSFCRYEWRSLERTRTFNQ